VDLPAFSGFGTASFAKFTMSGQPAQAGGSYWPQLADLLVTSDMNVADMFGPASLFTGSGQVLNQPGARMPVTTAANLGLLYNEARLANSAIDLVHLSIPGYNYASGFAGASTGDQAARQVTDGVTNSTTTITSATAYFTPDDMGAAITGGGIPTSITYITRVDSPTSVLINQNASNTSVANTWTIIRNPGLAYPAAGDIYASSVAVIDRLMVAMGGLHMNFHAMFRASYSYRNGFKYNGTSGSTGGLAGSDVVHPGDYGHWLLAWMLAPYVSPNPVAAQNFLLSIKPAFA
jgi:hypothetical protein